MKLDDIAPRTVTGGTLLAWAEDDYTFDLFSPASGVSAVSTVSARELAPIRPAIVTSTHRVVWGFHYRPVWRETPAAEFPVITLRESSPAMQGGGEARPAQEGADQRGDDRDCRGASVTIQALRWALTAEQRPGQYRFSELDRIRRLVETAGAVACWEEIVPLCSTGNDPWPLIERFRGVPATAATAVDDGTIDLRTAEAIPREYAAEVDHFLPLVSPLSFSNRRHALRMVVELLRAGADGSALRRELSQLSAQELMGELRRRRYPTLSQLESRLETIRRNALSGSGATLAAPTNFEGDRFQVSFAFRSASELRSRLRAVARLEEYTDELLDLLF
ncbi:MAG: hypothetical protein ACOCYB_06200 [Alkalispirochaeta sp.]